MPNLNNLGNLNQSPNSGIPVSPGGQPTISLVGGSMGNVNTAPNQQIPAEAPKADESTTGLGMSAPATAAPKKDYTMYIVIGLAVLVVGYMVYKYYKD